MTILNKTTLGNHTIDILRQHENEIAKYQGDLDLLDQEIKDYISANVAVFSMEIHSVGTTIYRDVGEGFGIALQPGSIIDDGSETRVVSSYITNNRGIVSQDGAIIDFPFTSDLPDNTPVTITTPLSLNLVNAINSNTLLTEQKDRENLIRAIAMT